MADDILKITVSEYGSGGDDPQLDVYKGGDGLVRFKITREIKRCSRLMAKEKDDQQKNYWEEKIKVMELLLALSEKLG